MEANSEVNAVEESAQHNHEEKSVKFIDNNNEDENRSESRGTYRRGTQAVLKGTLPPEDDEEDEDDEPIAPKRNVFPETEEEKMGPTDNGEETDGASHSTDALPETSENFIKIEERKVIDRLSKVVDVELSLESFRVDTEETPEEANEKETKSELKLEEEKPKPEVEESVTHTQESEANEEVNTFEVSHSHESVEDNTPKPVDVNEMEGRPEEDHSHNNGHYTEDINNRNEEQNEETFEAQNENHREEDTKPVIEDVLIKQNGRKMVYSSEEDVDEEADQMPDVIGFRSTLKKWSTGKPGPEEEAGVQTVNSKDKFKTLRQIRKGNTRSLMERFQTPTKS